MTPHDIQSVSRNKTASLPRRPYASPILFACLVILITSACRKEKPARPPSPPEVEVMEVIQQDVPIQHTWVGNTDGLVNATIRAQVTGYLISQNYQEGDFVQKGQVLFEIDPRPFQAALEQTKGNLARYEALHTNAKATLERIRPLVAQSSISQRDFDDAIGLEGSTAGRIITAKAAMEKAQLDLEFTKIISPIAGIAGIAKAQVGDLVGPNQGGELTTVSTVDPLKVYFSVNEQAYINFIQRFPTEEAMIEAAKKLVIELSLADGSIYPRQGTYFATDRHVDMRTGTLLVAALFPNPGNLIRPGQFVRVRVTIGTKEGALLVPQRAVAEIQGREQVAVVDAANHVEIRIVKTGERVGPLWVIDEGLLPGERVVAEGVQKVKHGLAVIPKPFTFPPSSAQDPSPAIKLPPPNR